MLVVTNFGQPSDENVVRLFDWDMRFLVVAPSMIKGRALAGRVLFYYYFGQTAQQKMYSSCRRFPRVESALGCWVGEENFHLIN